MSQVFVITMKRSTFCRHKMKWCCLSLSLRNIYDAVWCMYNSLYSLCLLANVYLLLLIFYVNYIDRTVLYMRILVNVYPVSNQGHWWVHYKYTWLITDLKGTRWPQFCALRKGQRETAPRNKTMPAVNVICFSSLNLLLLLKAKWQKPLHYYTQFLQAWFSF